MPELKKQLPKMTKELEDIFSGKKVPEFKVVDYTTEEGQKKLKSILKRQKEIQERTIVNWVRLNEFQCTI